MARFPFHLCCDDNNRIDFRKMAIPNIAWHIYWDWDFTITFLLFIGYPVYWILVSQLERRYGCLRRWCGGAYVACGLVAMTMMPMALCRGCRFVDTVRRQPGWWLLRLNSVLYSGYALVALGVVLVVASFRVIGLWTFLLGDFFGIHENKQDVRPRFPYTWFYHPMYVGASSIFLGISLVGSSQAGILLSVVAMIMYRIAVHYEHDVFCRYNHVALVNVGVQHDQDAGSTATPPVDNVGASSAVAAASAVDDQPLGQGHLDGEQEEDAGRGQETNEAGDAAPLAAGEGNQRKGQHSGSLRARKVKRSAQAQSSAAGALN